MINFLSYWIEAYIPLERNIQHATVRCSPSELVFPFFLTKENLSEITPIRKKQGVLHFCLSKKDRLIGIGI